jgi:hypothetical protein
MSRKLEKIWNSVKDKTKLLLSSGKREVKETYEAAQILLLLIEDKKVSPEQISFLKSQSIDIVKVLTIIGLQAVPGSSIAIIALEKAAEKYGFTLFPKSQTEINQK